jgi:glycosyltransferase involved in cell wall biosynthesis
MDGQYLVVNKVRTKGHSRCVTADLSHKIIVNSTEKRSNAESFQHAITNFQTQGSTETTKKTYNKVVYLANARLPTEKAHGYQICKMCEALALNGMEVVLLHPKRRQENPILQRSTVFEYYGIPPIFTVRTLPNWDIVPLSRYLPARGFMPMFFAHALVWGLYATWCAHREGADLYYTRESSATFWLVRRGLPTVYEGHGVPKRGQRWLLTKIAAHPALRLAVVLTSFIKQHFVELAFPAAKVKVLPDGVDISLFDKLPSREACRERLGVPPDRAVIGYVGRFQTMEIEKGIPELVQAMATIPPLKGEEPLLLCVGGPMEAVPAYEEIARRYRVPAHRLRFIDRVPNIDVPLWMRTCDVVTMPFHWNEHYAYFMSPLKLFEYMAAGAAIVATDLPATREVLRHGENAWLVTPGDAKALADGICQVLSDHPLAERMAQRARQEAHNYSWNGRALIVLDAVRHLEPLGV